MWILLSLPPHRRPELLPSQSNPIPLPPLLLFSSVVFVFFFFAFCLQCSVLVDCFLLCSIFVSAISFVDCRRFPLTFEQLFSDYLMHCLLSGSVRTDVCRPCPFGRLSVSQGRSPPDCASMFFSIKCDVVSPGNQTSNYHAVSCFDRPAPIPSFFKCTVLARMPRRLMVFCSLLSFYCLAPPSMYLFCLNFLRPPPSPKLFVLCCFFKRRAAAFACRRTACLFSTTVRGTYPCVLFRPAVFFFPRALSPAPCRSTHRFLDSCPV